MTTRSFTRASLAAVLLAALAAAQPAPAQPASTGTEPVSAEPANTQPVSTQSVSGRLPTPTTGTVTADLLGEGSVIAVTTRGNVDVPDVPLRRTLELISADGARHPVYSVLLEETPRGWFPGDFSLADWRPDLHTALLRVSRGGATDVLLAYNVLTGQTRTVPAPRRASAVGLAPDDTGVLFTSYRRKAASEFVTVLAWDGATTRLASRGEGPALTSADGTTMVSMLGRRWWITDLTSRTTRSITTPGLCSPRRWLDADSVVATCGKQATSQLRRVDLTGTSGPLGMRHTSGPKPMSGVAVIEDVDLRTTRGRSWYESSGQCGIHFLTRQKTSGVVQRVRMPVAADEVRLVAEREGQLLLARQDTDCGVRPHAGALTLFDPVAKTETVLTRLGRRETFREVISATEVKTWLW